MLPVPVALGKYERMSQCASVDEAQRKTHFDVIEGDSVVEGRGKDLTISSAFPL